MQGEISTVSYADRLFLSVLSRLLEEGNTEGAEEQKQRIEQLQRERRKVLQDNNMTHQPRFFKYAAVFLLVCVCTSVCSQTQCLHVFSHVITPVSVTVTAHTNWVVKMTVELMTKKSVCCQFCHIYF